MRKALLVACVVALAGCAGGRKQAERPVTVSDSDYGRLGTDQTAMVDQARTELGNSRDELARAKLRQTEAAQATNLAQADIGVADAELQRAASQAKLAEESNDPAQLARARSMADSAQLRKTAAQARLEYAGKLQAARAAEVTAAEKEVAYQEMLVEQSKLHALNQAQVPAGGKYDASRLEGAVAAARKEFDEASANARAAALEASSAEQRWQDLQRQLQARSGDPAQRG
jgi:hypothetical protein